MHEILRKDEENLDSWDERLKEDLGKILEGNWEDCFGATIALTRLTTKARDF